MSTSSGSARSRIGDALLSFSSKLRLGPGRDALGERSSCKVSKYPSASRSSSLSTARRFPAATAEAVARVYGRVEEGDGGVILGLSKILRKTALAL